MATHNTTVEYLTTTKRFVTTEGHRENQNNTASDHSRPAYIDQR